MDIYSSKKKARHAKKKHGKPMSKKQKNLMIVLISVVGALTLLLATVIGIFIWMTSDYRHNSDIDKDDDIAQITPISEGIINIALFGIDSRDTDSFKGLSDSIMILSVNTDSGKIKLISLMRDSLVEIPRDKGTMYNKINAAYNLGGPALAIKTINKNFGLDIKEYATVNFYGMADIIDAVGGLEIDVQQKELNTHNALNDAIREQALYLGLKNPPLVKEAGLQTLSGIQVVGWARIRSVATAEGVANDYGRTDRQRVVMEKLLNKALSMSVSQYPKLIKTILPYVETSLSYNEILKLSSVLSKKITFSQTRVPQTDYVITAPSIQGVGSAVYFNLEFAKDIIYAYIYDDIDQETYLDTHEIVRKGWYTGPTISPSTNTTDSTTQTSSQTGNTTSEDVSGTSSEDTGSDVSSSEGTSSDGLLGEVNSSESQESEEDQTDQTTSSSQNDTTTSEAA